MLDMEGLRAMMLAVTDLSKVVGHPYEYEHPEVWKVIDRVVKKARDRKIIVAAGTGYAFNTPEDIVGRVTRLRQHGVNAVLIQGLEYLFETYSRRFIKEIRDELGDKPLA
jgi:2-keto-3-deoxy-L-rhamnonate aldolase RhmA